MARLTEDATKTLFREFFIPVPGGEAATTAMQAREIAGRLGGRVVVKALVPAGKRGKSGAIRFAQTADEAERQAAELLGSQVKGYSVAKVLVETWVDSAQELYAAITYDPLRRGPVLLLSASGGVDVEELTAANRTAMQRLPLDPEIALSVERACESCAGLGLSGSALLSAASILSALDQVFKQYDATLAEINPLTLTPEGSAVAVGAVMNIDDDALLRQAELQQHLEFGAGGTWRKPTVLEQQVLDADKQYPGAGAVRFIEMEGDIGFGICGGGASLTTFDAIRKYGGHPANYCDISPGPGFEFKMNALIMSILSKPGLKGFIYGWNILSFARGLIASSEAVVAAVQALGIDTARFPVVARLAGVGEEQAHAVLAVLPGVHLVGRETSLDEAGRLIVELTRKGQKP